MNLIVSEHYSKHFDGLIYKKLLLSVNGNSSVAHVIEYDQNLEHLKMVISKSSAALNPATVGNGVGDGGTLKELVSSQPDLLFAVNGTFSHYRKNFYDWQHDLFNVGDPVGLVKISDREFYADHLYDTLNGYLQLNTNNKWSIVTSYDTESKYALSSRPLLILNNAVQVLPLNEMKPVPSGVVNPPSFLGHGLEHHARTAVGVNSNGSLVFIVVEGEGSGSGSEGVTLPVLQQLGIHLKLTSMLNLDGGGSSRYWVNDNTVNGTFSDVAPDDEERILGHVLMVFSKNLG